MPNNCVKTKKFLKIHSFYSSKTAQIPNLRTITSMETTCTPCNHGKETGWFGELPDEATAHCRKCHRNWKRHGDGHCDTCCEHFASDKAFDLHRDGTHGVDRHCVDPGTVVWATGTPKLFLHETVYGPIWSTNPPAEKAGELKAA